MGKCHRKEIVKLISVSNQDGNPVNDWRVDYIGTVGLLAIFKSERIAPGKHYAYYFPNEPGEAMQRYFNTSPGVLTEKDNMFILEGNHIYIFEVGDYLSDEELAVLLLDINYNFYGHTQ